MSDGTSTKRLTPSEWASIVTLYERGDANVKQLAERFNISRQSIYSGLQERGIEKSSRLHEVRSEVEDQARAARLADVQEARKTKQTYKTWIDSIARLTMKRIIDGSQPGAILATQHADVLVLNNAMKIIAKARDEQWEIQDVRKLLEEMEDELPDLNIGEYTEEELAELREANERDYQENLVADEE